MDVQQNHINLGAFTPSVRQRVQTLLEEVVDPYLEELKLAGVPRKAEDIERSAYISLHKYGIALSLREMGVPTGRIAQKIGEKSQVVRGWLNKGKLPAAISHRKKERRKRLEKQVQIPHFEPSSDFAYFLGAYMATTRSGKAKMQLCFTTQSPESADKLYYSWKKFSGLSDQSLYKTSNNPAPGKPLKWTVRGPALSLLRYLNKITSCNTTLPWEHLVTQDERINYLRGAFDWNGHIGDGSPNKELGFFRVNGNQLIKELAVLMHDLGISPRIKLDRTASLTIRDCNDLRTFNSIVGFSASTEQERLDYICSLPRTVKAYGRSDYEAVLRYKEFNPEAKFSEIARAVSVPAGEVRKWLACAVSPPSVVRYELVEKIKQTLADFDAIGKLHREFRLGPGAARALLAEKSAADAAKNLRGEKPEVPEVTNEQIAKQILERELKRRFRDRVPERISTLRSFFEDCIIVALEDDGTVASGEKEIRGLLNFHIRNK